MQEELSSGQVDQPLAKKGRRETSAKGRGRVYACLDTAPEEKKRGLELCAESHTTGRGTLRGTLDRALPNIGGTAAGFGRFATINQPCCQVLTSGFGFHRAQGSGVMRIRGRIRNSGSKSERRRRIGSIEPRLKVVIWTLGQTEGIHLHP